MAKINILDNNTIDKIAAGEVVERPMSVVKELVENSIDSGASIITVEIRNGGLKLIRVTDNGSGIEKDQITNAFLSHATSKIKDASDLNKLFTLGFRGEALSSISAVSRVEVTSRTEDSLTGINYVIEGGKEITKTEVGAPTGTTIIVRDIFYNTLPRLKFLKSETTEGNYIADMLEHLALSMPHISFQFISNGTVRFSTSGRGDLREVIYRLYGRELSNSVRKIDVSDEALSLHVSGYLGLPRINRSNRSYEIFFINHRFVKSPLLSKAVEEGYIEYLMQHKFPFCILNFEFEPDKVDVNVHPTKQEVRLTEEKKVYDSIVQMVSSCLQEKEMVDDIKLTKSEPEKEVISSIPEQFEVNRIHKESVNKTATYIEITDNKPVSNEVTENKVIEISPTDNYSSDKEDEFFNDESDIENDTSLVNTVNTTTQVTISPDVTILNTAYEQIELFDKQKVLSKEARAHYRIIGQLFKTYWLIELNDELLIMDQHAAHEKVKFERLIAHFEKQTAVPSQNLMPPSVMSLTNKEKQILFDNLDRFSELGFGIEDFGEHEIVIRSIPMDLYGSNAIELISEIVKDLSELHKGQTPDIIRSRIASMACKAAIKGNNLISEDEVKKLLDEMLTLENPYNCPHGRPTLIKMTKKELEKKFHRIV